MSITRRLATFGLGTMAAGVRASNAVADSGHDDLVAAARKEGKVVVYSGYLSANTHGPIADAFKAKYGIEIENLNARGNELRERIRVEQLTGRFLGDVQHNATSLTQLWLATDQNLEPLGDLPNVARLTRSFRTSATSNFVPIFTIKYGFLVNSNLVSAAEQPRKWSDLLDRKWKDKILLDDPRAPGGGRVMFQQTLDKFGRGYHETLAALAPSMSRDYGEALRRVARGEFPLYAPLIFSQLDLVRGLPLRDALPEDGVLASSYSVSILKNAPHPNAARLLADFYLSDEVQAIYARTGHGVVIDGLKANLPPDIARIVAAPALMPEDNSRIDEYLALAKQIYK